MGEYGHTNHCKRQKKAKKKHPEPCQPFQKLEESKNKEKNPEPKKAFSLLWKVETSGKKQDSIAEDSTQCCLSERTNEPHPKRTIPQRWPYVPNASINPLPITVYPSRLLQPLQYSVQAEVQIILPCGEGKDGWEATNLRRTPGDGTRYCTSLNLMLSLRS